MDEDGFLKNGEDLLSTETGRPEGSGVVERGCFHFDGYFQLADKHPGNHWM